MNFSGPSQAVGVYLEEVEVERAKLVMYILLNSGEKQVLAKTFELFHVGCMHIQAGKVVGVWVFVFWGFVFGVFFPGKVL